MWRILKLNIVFTKKHKIIIGTFFGVLCLSFLAVGASATSSSTDSNCWQTEGELNAAGQNDILYYCPGNCVSKTPGTLCGSTAIEKYWSAISQYVEDPIDIAGIMGNIRGEGDFNPVEWEAGPTAEGGGIDSNGNLYLGWDYYFNGHSSTTGVGAVAITWDLGHYLNYVNDNYPDLLKYYKNTTEYAYNWLFHPNGYRQGEESYGDDLLEKIGDAEFDKLVALDVEYFMEKWPPTVESDKINNYVSHNASTPGEAAAWWAVEFEGCQGCQYGTSVVADRSANAEYFYDLLKDFTCSGSSSNSSSNGSSSSMSTVSGDQITWIGDSYSVQADNKGLLSQNFSGLDIGPGSNNTSTSYIQGSKFVSSGSNSNPSCLTILQDIINSNELRPYLVFACGTNGGWSDSDISAFTSLLDGKDTKAIVVTSKIPNNDYAASNDRLKAMAEANDNIYLADWTAVYDESYFSRDPEKIHPVTDPGYEKWIGVIAGALSDANSNGCTTYTGDYPEYTQCDPRWGSLSYGPGNTFCSGACGATAMATIATITSGQDVLPTDIANLLGDQYYYTTGMRVLDPIVCEKYGCEVEVIEVGSTSENLANIRQYLKDGWMIHASGGCDDGGGNHGHGATCPYSRGGHYVAILALKDDNTAIVSDPGWDGITEYALTDLASGAGALTAIRGNGSGGGSCDNYCNDSGPSLSGLTEAQAEKLAEYYNGPDVDADEYGLPYGKTNCVSFSMWFSMALAGLTWGNGNGRDVAHSLAVENNLTEGTEPRPYALFAVTHGITMCGDALCGHTGIVVAVNGDEVLTVEAAYPSTPAYVTTRDISYFENTVYGNSFAYLDSYVDQAKLKSIVGN